MGKYAPIVESDKTQEEITLNPKLSEISHVWISRFLLVRSADNCRRRSLEPDPAVKLIEKFDLYGMKLLFLNKSMLRGTGNSSLQPEEFYRTILAYQVKSDSTAKIFIPEGVPSGHPPSTIRLKPFPYHEYQRCRQLESNSLPNTRMLWDGPRG